MNLKGVLSDFASNPSNKIVVVYGPTACWKTDLAVEIAKFMDTEIISTDSQQIFKGLDIGTGKVTKKEMKWVKHHMIDIVSPNEEYSVWVFKKQAEKTINDLHNLWKVPVLAWWTGLYIDSLIFDFNIPKLPASKELRDELEEFRLHNGNEALFNKLADIDPEYAKELHPNNYRYVIRAIEVKTLTWKSKLEFRGEKKLKYDVLFVTPYAWDRKWLYERINLRVKKMFEAWFVEEVEKLLYYFSDTDFGMKSIWYKEVCSYLNRNLTEKEAMELVQKNSRNYAKRQLTWFNKYKKYDWKVFEGVSKLD